MKRLFENKRDSGLQSRLKIEFAFSVSLKRQIMEYDRPLCEFGVMDNRSEWVEVTEI